MERVLSREEKIAAARIPELVHRCYSVDYAFEFGVKTAVLLKNLTNREEFLIKARIIQKEGEWFSTTRDEIYEITALTRFEQETAVKTLTKAGILTRKLMGLPAKMYYSIDHEKLFDVRLEHYSQRQNIGQERDSTASKTEEENTSGRNSQTRSEAEHTCQRESLGLESDKTANIYKKEDTKDCDKSKDLSHRFPEVASLSSENDSSSFRCSTPNGISDNDSYNHNNSVESEVKTEIEEKNNVVDSTTTENKNPVSSATQRTRELTIEEEIEKEEKEDAELPVPWDNSASVVRRAKASVSESNESPRSGVVGGLSEKETHSKQSTSTQKEQRSQEKNEVHIPEKVKPYLEVWRAAGLHVPGENTKRFEQSIESLKKLISGRVFQQTEFSHLARPYSLDDWTKAVWNFQTAAIDPSYYPSNKKPLLSMTPNEFIYNPFNKQQRSCFVYYYSNSPQSITPLYKDDHPEMTNLLIRCYRVDILKGAVQDLSVNDKNKFMLLAKKVEEFFRSNQKNLTNGLGQNREKKAKAVWECAMEYFANDPTRLSPHMLLGEWFIKDALPKFLIKNGYFRQSSLLSPFKSNPYKL